MKRPRQDDIPITKISNSTVVGDFSSLDGESKILFLDPKCVLIGLNGVPYMLFITPGFDLNKLIKVTDENLYEIERIVVQSTFTSKPGDEDLYGDIPDWLLSFKKVDLLKLEKINIDELWLLRNLPVQHLVLKKVKFDSPTILKDSVLQFSSLAEITHDNTVSSEIIKEISLIKPKIKFYYETD